MDIATERLQYSLIVSVQDLENLKTSVGWTEEDERYRHMAGEVLADQTRLANNILIVVVAYDERETARVSRIRQR